MKPQDLIFIVIFITLLLYRRGRYTWLAGFCCLILSALLLWLFDNRFTMQRLTWYAAAFFFAYTSHMLIFHRKSKA
ncbi:MAG: hypothetical protein KatS3mg087_0964 [Patescibacteria group bacterium]|nr:MAG: hypothetical protein KatS3mg087_0964 [Patescibacteria group bacterium]